ncbi:MAG: hypothetical protein HYT87_08775 [Nitrospirae bacterium]|nr:hypothetical protein [Nitrospirota bacterium]
MRVVFISLIGLAFLAGPLVAWSQSTSPQSSGAALQSSNILNPNISAIGWFQAEAGQRETEAGEDKTPRFQFKEAELAFQSVVDPFARADFFVAVEGEGGVDLEEGYLTWFALPADLSLKLGKFKADFGKFNRTHRPETAFADRPLAQERYLGDEGLASIGGALSWHVPNPWWLINLDAEAMNMPDTEETPAFGAAGRNDLLYVGRLSSYHDLTEALNANVGASVALGTAGPVADEATGESFTPGNRLYGVDLTMRWKNPRRAIYGSWFWQTEAFLNNRERAADSALATAGLFSHLEYQFARRWRTGARYDWSESPTDRSDRVTGGLAYLTFATSEFCRISLQGKQVWKEGGAEDTLGLLKVTFNIGPHGADPF